MFEDYYDSYTSELAEILYKPEIITPITFKTTSFEPEGSQNLNGPSSSEAPPSSFTKASTDKQVGNKIIYLPGAQGPTGPQGPIGPRGPSGDNNNIDISNSVSQTQFEKQVDGILYSIENGVEGLGENLAKAISTGTLTTSGNATIGGDLGITGDITKIKNLTYSWPSSHTASGVLQNDGAGTLVWTTLGARCGDCGLSRFL